MACWNSWDCNKNKEENGKQPGKKHKVNSPQSLSSKDLARAKQILFVVMTSMKCNWQFECKEIFLKIATDCNFFYEQCCFYL